MDLSFDIHVHPEKFNCKAFKHVEIVSCFKNKKQSEFFFTFNFNCPETNEKHNRKKMNIEVSVYKF